VFTFVRRSRVSTIVRISRVVAFDISRMVTFASTRQRDYICTEKQSGYNCKETYTAG
jgi:hypothetical protein